MLLSVCSLSYDAFIMNIARCFSVFNRIQKFHKFMPTGVPTVVSRNICISQQGIFSAYTNEMKLVLYIIHITVDALSIFAWNARISSRLDK